MSDTARHVAPQDPGAVPIATPPFSPSADGDVTTLANPEVADDIRHEVQSLTAARGEVPRKPTPEELEEIKAFGNEQTRSRERATRTRPARSGEAAACRFPGEKREPAVAVHGEPRERKGGSNGFL